MTLIPLAEHFHSIQGEGVHVGRLMHFLRLPGCNVGRSQYELNDSGPLQVLPQGAAAKVCTAFNGQEFFCDTDYSLHEQIELETLMSETFEWCICLTGGEPLLHQKQLWFKELYEACDRSGVSIHVETSGTVMPTLEYNWLTVSPKAGYRPEVIAKANQLKFLVTADLTEQDWKLMLEISHKAPRAEVFLSPVFDPNYLVTENLNKCMELLTKVPHWRLGMQWHKFINAR